ncbi:ABC transporter substrate-binding protein [Novispirillum itersonii]|uniref:Peptide/nickel transport system substrate-binding protein n=1 Tax=Novispirillum itersonii TaxID=189 RepID=A0A7X0DKF3_NOVIT|nr:ABC transporter substrate-binding protein [Novispirillum itersonii]MBB6208893.1 peptide/nickel transport system substrate-binding protein [Novispirillum itersonii]
MRRVALLPPRLRRPVSALLLSLGLALPAPAALADAPAGILTVTAPWEVSSLDPARHGYVFTRLQIAETLVDVDKAGGLVPGLAEGWQVDAAGVVWTLTLRRGVLFHDGTPMTAETVAAALRTAAAKPGPLASAPLESIAVGGPETVVIRLKEPFAPLLATLAGTAAQILAPASYGPDGTVTQVIGTGPFRLTEVKPPQSLAAERFDRYWGQPAGVGKMTYLAAGRGETRAMMAESGDADVVYTLDPASRQRLQRNPAVTVQALPLPRTVSVKLNAGDPALSDLRVRRALALAVDRGGIATGLLREPGSAAGQMFPPGTGDWPLPEGLPLRADLTQAAALLTEAGWVPGSDGLRSRDGKPLKLTLRTFPDRPELPVIATALQAQWREIGVDVAVSVGNSSDVPAGHRDGTLQMALMARSFGLVPDPLVTALQDFGPGGGDWGAMNWSSPAMEQALATLKRGTDPATATGLRQTVSRILLAELPVIPVSWYQQTVAVSKRVSGLTLDPYERSYRLSEVTWVR